MHILVWGSILIWFVIIPITSSPGFYSSFFQYGGVAYKVLSTTDFWFYLPIATVVALFPTIFSRLVTLYRQPTYVDFVRLKERKEGEKLFKRKTVRRRPVTARSGTLKRSGYAFAHQEGFADLISTGHIFGLDSDHVQAEHFRRRSILISQSHSRASHSRAGTEPPPNNTSITTAAIAAAANLTTAVVGIPNSRASIKIDVVEQDTNSSIPDVTSVETLTGDGVPQEVRHDHASHEGTQGSDKPAQDPPAEETDAALLQPSLRIPGLVDSPDSTTKQDTVATSGDQEGGGTEVGDGDKMDKEFPVV